MAEPKKVPDWVHAWDAQREAHKELDMETQPWGGPELWLVKLSVRLTVLSVWWHTFRKHKPHA